MRIIVTVVMLAVSFIVAQSIIGGMNDQMATDNVTMPTAVSVMMNLMPAIMIVAGILSLFAGGAAVKHYITVRKWRDFGNRMKEAYSAKFGGANPGFNEEVDQHIKMMEALGHGPTKEIGEDWLKRMAKFVEIPYIIPEEEHLSEVEKTVQYDPDHKELP